MRAMLPTIPQTSARLADVLENGLHEATRDRESGATRSTRIICVVDGLGWHALKARSGHARTLRSRLDSESSALALFPTTTVAQLASLTTGVSPGTHGLLGYSLRAQTGGGVFNLISGWPGHADPEEWQARPTIFEQATHDDVEAVAIGPSKYAGTDFSRAILRGAHYLGVDEISQRFAAAAQLSHAPGARVIYLYVPELDAIAHHEGWQSAHWSERLEEVDAGLRSAIDVARDATFVVTADHGMVDVDAHVYLDEWPLLDQAVEAVAGEPRAPQLYLRAGFGAPNIAHELNEWLAANGRDRAAVAVTRDEMIASGWLGAVDSALTGRMGDVLVVASDEVTAIYDRTRAKPSSLRMIGQHGALTDSETLVPLLRFDTSSH